MRPVAKIASCEIAFTPIATDDYVADVKKVLNIIQSYDFEYDIGMLSTTVKGDVEEIYKMLEEIYFKMDEECKFSMDIKISNACGI